MLSDNSEISGKLNRSCCCCLLPLFLNAHIMKSPPVSHHTQLYVWWRHLWSVPQPWDNTTLCFTAEILAQTDGMKVISYPKYRAWTIKLCAQCYLFIFHLPASVEHKQINKHVFNQLLHNPKSSLVNVYLKLLCTSDCIRCPQFADSFNKYAIMST